ncbi:GlsB/YeaQ/YmgE family stress response membrane protein [Bythopirellula goksoeyrii]|uniref:Transglycosylase associated protein n=1 Tax=Bythopirellula goksoeyrii TaxID=1400387 RepID=A0A5B9Q2P0_9BACT|nr:GlsB/YeaQ/YmgE family stress response membrane protein [Bythopirellula goksoeyrii]QEG33287.1 Transglycosylase associated protein [Bythopirellula goksoeyrii]
MGGLIWFILIGILAGWLAGTFMKGGGFGILGNLIVGVIGAIVGGLVFGLLGFESTNILGSLITATVGAILFIALLRVIKQA